MLFLAPSDIAGRGVYTLFELPQGKSVMTFRGPIVHGRRLPNDTVGEPSWLLQVGSQLYMGPSGELDDEVNHSCDPNCYLLLRHDPQHPNALPTGHVVVLVTRRAVPIGVELTYDYGTTIGLDDGWSMVCRCGAPNCRRLVRTTGRPFWDTPPV